MEQATGDAREIQLATEIRSLLGNQPYKAPKEFSKKELDVDNGIFDLGSDKPRLGRNKTVIVSGVAFSANRDVVVIQEAKESARGLWYLPAGRLELNESLQAAVKREFLEEAGLQFEPRRLISVECRGCAWIRFNFLGDVVGGQLKTTADKESLCARWAPLMDVLHQKLELRSKDIIPLLLLANHLHAKAKLPLKSPSAELAIGRLPLQVSWQSCHLRLVLLCRHLRGEEGAEAAIVTMVLCRTLRQKVGKRESRGGGGEVGFGARLPLLRLPHPLWLDSVGHMLTNKITGEPVLLNSVLHCEFASSDGANCGVFLTLLCRLSSQRPPERPPPQSMSPEFDWVPVDEALCRHLLIPDEFVAGAGVNNDLAVKTNPYSAHLCLLGGCVHAAFG